MADGTDAVDGLSGQKPRGAGRIQSDTFSALSGVPVGNLPALSSPRR